MLSSFRWRRQTLVVAASFALSGVVVSCGDDTVAPVHRVPAHLDAVGSLNRSAAVGSVIDSGVTVRVTDASGNPVAEQGVAFAVTAGNGSTTPRLVVTDQNGQATTQWTLGTIPGPNEVTASLTGVTSHVKFEATGNPGPATSVALSPRSIRLLDGVDSTFVSVVSFDGFGNRLSRGVSLVARDPSLVSVDSLGIVRVLRRGASTYLVASAGTLADSILITILSPGQGACTGVATPLDIAIGQVLTDVDPGAFCVRSTTPDAEYAVIPFYDSSIPGSSIQLQVRGQGLTSLPLPNANVFTTKTTRTRSGPTVPSLSPDLQFEMRLRKRERDEGTSRIAAARSTWRSRKNVVGTGSRLGTIAAAGAVPAIGDLVKFNVSTASYCDVADMRTGRIVAVTDRAIVVADTANPPGGFTDAEYQSFGVTFDTLVDPVNRNAFGAPTDIDNNGRVTLFFTRAVNELTTPGTTGVVLGFFYSRDLLPKVSTTTLTNCATSNEGELMYLLVPDTGGVVNGNKRSKAQVLTFADGTASHEFQHMINAGRRLYVNGVGQSFEERWLDEGLSHVAEDLNFWRASGQSPRTNLDANVFSDSKALNAFATFEQNNFSRYSTYLARPEGQSPIGSDSFDDDLPTRGAIWSFLRFAADHQPAGQDNQFWFNLANSTTHGVANLTNALGASPGPVLRDWAISVFLDDDAANVDARFLQPSWNFRSAMSYNGAFFPLVTHILSDGTTTSLSLAADGVSFYRFSVANNAEALLSVTTSGGQPAPATVKVAVVRVR